MMARKVVVCGDFASDTIVFEKLDKLHAENPFVLIACPSLSGSSRLALEWADANDVPVRTYLPRWHVHGGAAEAMRNTLMLDEVRPDLVVVFPGRRTDDLLRKARTIAERRALSIVDCR